MYSPDILIRKYDKKNIPKTLLLHEDVFKYIWEKKIF